MENEDKKNVKSLDAERKKRKATEKPDKINRALVANMIARQMISNNVYAYNPFPRKFVVNCPENGKHIFYEVINDKNVVEKTGKEAIKDTIIEWCSENWLSYPELLIDAKTAGDVFRVFMGLAPKIHGPMKNFEFADGSSYVTHRLNFVPDLDREFHDWSVSDKRLHDQYPFMEFFSRASAPDPLAAFIGGIFYADSYLQQYLYLWGHGNDGKGAMLRALKDVLGNAYHSDSFAFMNRFWTSSFLGKRLVVFPDSNDQSAMQSGQWKQLTGGDTVRIELKGEATFCAQLDAKYIITSNFAPVLKMDRADQRRAVVVFISAIDGEISPAWEKKLRRPEQLKTMIEYCCYKYRQMCVSGDEHLPIKVDEESQQEQIQNADETLEQKIQENFRFGPTYVAKVNDIRQALGLDFNSNKVARILSDRFGCVKFKTRTDKNDRRVYYAGIGLRFPMENAGDINSMTASKVSGSTGYKKAVLQLSLLAKDGDRD